MAKRNDEPVKIDAEVLRVARIVASFERVPLAEYLSERLRPLVKEDLARHAAAVQAEAAGPTPAKPKRKGGAKPPG